MESWCVYANQEPTEICGFKIKTFDVDDVAHSEMEGVTARPVANIDITMSDGEEEFTSKSPVNIEPQPLSFNRLDVVVVVEKVDELNDELQADENINTVEEGFLMMDEQVYAPTVDVTKQRGQESRRGRGRRNARRVRGEMLEEVYVTDDDVPDDVQCLVMRADADREARTRSRAKVQRKRASNYEIVDGDEGGDEALFDGDESFTRFDWSPMDTYRGEREIFLVTQIGPTVPSETAYGAFRQYWDDDILSHIVTATNRYAKQLKRASDAFARDWYDTNIHEILILFSFWIMLGIIRMPTIKSCFTLTPILKTNIFRRMFSHTRYGHLCRVLHFANSNKLDGSNRLFCFGPILNHLNSRFQSAYIPSQNICINESLSLWKGDLSFRQYITDKAAQFRVKTFELYESSTGYIWSFLIDTGPDTALEHSLPSSLLKSTAIVLTLIKPLLDKGYTLFMDNWFNSPLLARVLKSRQTDCVGTLRAARRHVPPLLKLCQLKEGQFTARHSSDVVVMAFHDKKKILTISTCHGTLQSLAEPKPHRPDIYKPQVILDYNKVMSSVEREVQLLDPYMQEKKNCAKWHVKEFKRLLNYSISNSRILLQASTGVPKDQLVFQLELVELILHNHLEKVPRSGAARDVSSITHVSRFTQNTHWPKLITKENNSNGTTSNRCIWCSTRKNTQSRTTYVCCVCKVPLCLEPCFQLYHTPP